MSGKIEQYVVETLDHKIFRIFAKNEFDAASQVRSIIAKENSLCNSNKKRLIGKIA